jgi:hypothetical protein
VLGQNATRNPGPLERDGPQTAADRTPRDGNPRRQGNWTKAEIRKSYKALIKVLHPDMNGGDRSDEERLQEVVWAWDQIKISRNFPD